MQITAAVVRERSAPFVLDTLELCDPRPDEVVVRVVASGMCQTDLHGRDGYFASPYPAVYGHEGAGVVHAVGSAVRSLAAGDHVVISFPWCGTCANCQAHRYCYCVQGRRLKMHGTRDDGSTLLSKNGTPVYSAFFQQSSFGTYALTQERYAVRCAKMRRWKRWVRSRAAGRLEREPCSMRCGRSRATVSPFSASARSDYRRSWRRRSQAAIRSSQSTCTSTAWRWRASLAPRTRSITVAAIKSSTRCGRPRREACAIRSILRRLPMSCAKRSRR